MDDYYWISDALKRRNPVLLDPMTDFALPMLEDPEMQRLIAAEVRLLLDDTFLSVLLKIYVSRHLIRCGLTPDEVAELLGVTPHSARAAGVQAAAKIGAKLSNFDQYRYTLVPPPSEEDRKLIADFHRHRVYGNLHAAKVRFFLPN